jgi:ABC-type nitrate/sulfonate/bicarbonate transport system substrate-binding protein
MRPDYDDMMDWKYREENPGYERPIAYTPDPEDPDRDPEIELMVADIYARDNGKRRENNLRTENAQLRALLEENGIDPDDANRD